MVNCKLHFLLGNIVADKENLLRLKTCLKLNINFTRAHSVNIKSLLVYNFKESKVAVSLCGVVYNKVFVINKVFKLSASLP